MKNKKLFMRRLQMTALFLMIYIGMSMIPIPFAAGVDGVDNIFAQIAAINGASNDGLKLFSLGLMPFFMSTLVVKILTQGISPSLAELSRGTQQQRKTFIKISRVIFWVIALTQSAGLVSIYNKETELFSSMLSIEAILTIATLFAGSLLCRFVAEQITKKGISNGLVIIISFMLLRNMTLGFIRNYSAVHFGAFFYNLMVLLGLLVVAIVIQGRVIKVPVTIDTLTPDEEGNNHRGLIKDSFRINLLCVGITPMIYLSFLSPAFDALGMKNQGVLAVVSLAAIYIFTNMTVKSDFNVSGLVNTFMYKGIYLVGIKEGAEEMRAKMNHLFSRIITLNTIVLFSYYVVGILIAQAVSLSVLRESRVDGVQILILAYAILDIFYTVRAYFIKDAIEVLY